MNYQNAPYIIGTCPRGYSGQLEGCSTGKGFFRRVVTSVCQNKWARRATLAAAFVLIAANTITFGVSSVAHGTPPVEQQRYLEKGVTDPNIFFRAVQATMNSYIGSPGVKLGRSHPANPDNQLKMTRELCVSLAANQL